MTVGQYVSKFEELAKFSSYLKFNLDENWKAMKFESSLNPKIKNAISIMEIRNYAVLVNKSMIAERNLNDLVAEHQNKRKKEKDRNRFIQPQFEKHKNHPRNRNQNQPSKNLNRGKPHLPLPLRRPLTPAPAPMLICLNVERITRISRV